MKLAELKKGFRWLIAGEMTNPETDFHCWPRGSGKSCVSIQERFKISGKTFGMILRAETPISHLYSFSVAKD